VIVGQVLDRPPAAAPHPNGDHDDGPADVSPAVGAVIADLVLIRPPAAVPAPER
jgi:hypothetical protein